MKFVLQMAVRETRAAWRRLLFFFVCIAVGVAAIVALRSVIQNVREVFGTRSAVADRGGRDHQHHPRLDAGGANEIIDRRLAEASAITRTETISTPTMVRPADESRAVARMVELQGGRSATFPLYGSIDARRRAAVLARAARESRRARAARSC